MRCSVGSAQAGGPHARITGDLTLRGVTREIVLHAEFEGRDIDPWGNERVGLAITGELSRGEFGMTFNHRRSAAATCSWPTR